MMYIGDIFLNVLRILLRNLTQWNESILSENNEWVKTYCKHKWVVYLKNHSSSKQTNKQTNHENLFYENLLLSFSTSSHNLKFLFPWTLLIESCLLYLIKLTFFASFWTNKTIFNLLCYLIWDMWLCIRIYVALTAQTTIFFSFSWVKCCEQCFNQFIDVCNNALIW
jgi:hypothetical protein